MIRAIISAVAAYAISKLVFSQFGFEYRVFKDPFDLSKFAIDLGVYTVLFIGFYRILNWVKFGKSGHAG
jgi:hypothetical protein